MALMDVGSWEDVGVSLDSTMSLSKIDPRNFWTDAPLQILLQSSQSSRSWLASVIGSLVVSLIKGSFELVLTSPVVLLPAVDESKRLANDCDRNRDKDDCLER